MLSPTVTLWIQILMIVLIPALAWLDRERGLPKAYERISKPVALIGCGFVTALLTGHWFDWNTIVITVSVAILHGIGFGEPIGHALSGKGGQKADDGSTYEVWQVLPILRENPWAALAARGIVLGFAGLPAFFYNGDIATPIIIALGWGIAFPLSCAVIRWVIKPDGTGEAENAEVRGGLAATIMFVLQFA